MQGGPHPSKRDGLEEVDANRETICGYLPLYQPPGDRTAPPRKGGAAAWGVWRRAVGRN